MEDSKEYVFCLIFDKIFIVCFFLSIEDRLKDCWKYAKFTVISFLSNKDEVDLNVAS